MAIRFGRFEIDAAAPEVREDGRRVDLAPMPEAVSAFGAAVAWAEEGRSDRALDALERAAADREPGAMALSAHPSLRRLAGQPRYEAPRRRVLQQLHG